jgi:hypothetical protein
MVQLSPDEVKTHVDNAIERAKKFVERNTATGKLNPTLDADTTPMTTTAIGEFFAQTPHPYDDPKIRAAVGNIITSILNGAQPAGEGEAQNVTYLSGAYGSRGLLEALAQTPQTDKSTDGQTNEEKTISELKKQLDNSAQWNFDTLKKRLHEEAGISLKPHGTPPYDQYGKWRGLLSGIDTELAAIAAEKKLPYVIDNSLAPLGNTEKDNIIRDLGRDSGPGKNLQVFAVALTPEEAVAEVKRQNVGASLLEAEHTARNFHDYFNVMEDSTPNLTLVNKEGKVIFKKQNEHLRIYALNDLGQWNKAFDTPNMDAVMHPLLQR